MLGLGIALVGAPVLYFLFRDRPVPSPSSDVVRHDDSTQGLTLLEAVRGYRFWALGVAMLLICGCVAGLITNLVTRIPHKIAMELMLLGETIDVQRAYEVGYVNKVVPVSELKATAMDWAERIAATAPMPSRMLKRFTSETLAKGPSELAGIARVQVEAVSASADAKEGPKAFAEKRPPKYTGK